MSSDHYTTTAQLMTELNYTTPITEQRDDQVRKELPRNLEYMYSDSYCTKCNNFSPKCINSLAAEPQPAGGAYKTASPVPRPLSCYRGMIEGRERDG